MKKIKIFLCAICMLGFSVSCDENGNLLVPTLTEAEIVEGLKSALAVGTDTSVTKLNRVDAYFKDQALKILLPPEAKIVVDNIAKVPGGQALVDDVVLKMNRGAEQAAIQAKPIFIDAITSMTIADASNILFSKDAAGNRIDSSATAYLRKTTNANLYNLFKPKIAGVLDQVGASSAWNTLFSNWNNLGPFITILIPNYKTVNPDLNDHATNMALKGLFKKIAEQEKDIRENPADRVNDILKKVFGEAAKRN